MSPAPKPGPAPLEDPEATVRRAQRGDKEAERRLYEHFVPLLRARVQRRLPGLVRRKVGASDVVQEAYLTAFQRLEQFEDRGSGSFESWLSQIVENKVRDEMRRFLGTDKRDVRREGPDAQVVGVTGAVPTPSSAAESNEDREALQRQLAHLSERHRRVITLVNTEALPLAEVGARMGISAEAARKLYARAIGRLARRVSGDGPG